jgi:hypothetical protein
MTTVIGGSSPAVTFPDSSTQSSGLPSGITATPTNGQIPIGNGTGYTTANITAGSGISVTNGAGSISIAATGGGTVTSVATGNGLSGGTITGSGTLVVACPSFNSVGSYVAAVTGLYSPGSISAGGNVAAGSGDSQINIGGYFIACGVCYSANGSISGTWKWMTKGATRNSGGGMTIYGIACRVA